MSLSFITYRKLIDTLKIVLKITIFVDFYILNSHFSCG